jgi:hypothetical protein
LERRVWQFKHWRFRPLQRSKQSSCSKEEKRGTPDREVMAERADLTCNGYFCRPSPRRERCNLTSAWPSSQEADILLRYPRNPPLSFLAQTSPLMKLGRASALGH